jgi:ADP-ribosylglycohydrolase
MHSMGTLDDASLRADAAAVTRITHGSPLAMTLVEAAARAVAIAARHERPLSDLRQDVAAGLPEGEVRRALGQGDSEDSHLPVAVLMSALDLAGSATSFQGALEDSVAPGGATDARAALVGALYGGHHGSAAIPLRLIDGLEARIYVSLAVPWFYRTVAKLRGRAIELRADFGPF